MSVIVVLDTRARLPSHASGPLSDLRERRERAALDSPTGPRPGRRGPDGQAQRRGCAAKKSHRIRLALISWVTTPLPLWSTEVPGQVWPPPATRYSSTSV